MLEERSKDRKSRSKSQSQRYKVNDEDKSLKLINVKSNGVEMGPNVSAKMIKAKAVI